MCADLAKQLGDDFKYSHLVYSHFSFSEEKRERYKKRKDSTKG